MKVRYAILITTVALLGLGSAPDANAIGMGFGVRAGQMFNYDNPDLEIKLIEPKDLKMLGVHVTLFSLGMLNIEGSAEYSSDETTRDIFEYLGMGVHTPVMVPVTVRDYGFYVTGRYKITQGIWGIHIGGGVNVHRMSYKVDIPSNLPPFDQPYEIPGSDWHTGIHGLAGVSFGPPMSPLRIFAEIRIAKISFGGEAGQQATALAGITFGSF